MATNTSQSGAVQLDVNNQPVNVQASEIKLQKADVDKLIARHEAVKNMSTEQYLSGYNIPGVSPNMPYEQYLAPGEQIATDVESLRVAANPLMTDMFHAYLNGIDQTQISAGKGKLDRYQKIIDDSPEKLAALEKQRQLGVDEQGNPMTDETYQSRLYTINSDVANAKMRVADYQKEIEANNIEILNNPVSRKYQIKSALTQAQGSESSLWDSFRYNVPETFGSSSSLMGQQLVATFGGEAIKKLSTAVIGALAPEPVATKIAAGVALTTAVSLMVNARMQETDAESGDAITSNQEALMAKWFFEHPNQEPTEEDLRAIRKQARLGIEELENANNSLVFLDIGEALLLPGQKISKLFKGLSPLETGLSAFAKANRYTRLGTTAAKAYGSWVGEKFEEGLQFASQKRQADFALEGGLYENEGFMRNLLTDSKDVLQSLDYSPYGVLRDKNGFYSHDPNFQFAEQSGGLLSMIGGGGIAYSVSAARDLYLYNKIKKEIIKDGFNTEEDANFKLKSSILFSGFENDRIPYVIEAMKNVGRQKDVEGNPLLSEEEIATEIGNIAIAQKKYDAVNKYLNNFDNWFAGKESRAKKKIIKEDLFHTVLSINKHESEINKLESEKAKYQGGTTPLGNLSDIEDKINHVNKYIDFLEGKVAIPGYEFSKDLATVEKYSEKAEAFKKILADLNKQRTEIRESLDPETLKDFDSKTPSDFYDPIIDDISLEQSDINRNLVVANMKYKMASDRYATLKTIKDATSLDSYVISEVQKETERKEAYDRMNSKDKPSSEKTDSSENTGTPTSEKQKTGKTSVKNTKAPVIKEATVQKVGTLNEYIIVPDETGSTEGKVNPETGFMEYTVLNPNGNIEVVSQEKGWYKTNETIDFSDPRHWIASVDHYIKPFKYNLSKERRALERVMKSTGKSLEELLKEFPEAFPAHANEALYNKITARKDYRNFIDLILTRKFSEKNINFGKVVFESETGLIGIRTEGLNMILRLTDPDDPSNVLELSEIYPPDFYAFRQPNGELTPIDFSDGSQMNLEKFNSMFRVGVNNTVTQEQFETFVRNWKAVKSFKTALEAAYKGMDLTEPAVVNSNSYFINLNGVFDWVEDGNPYGKMTSSALLENAPIYYFDINPAKSKWITSNSDHPGYDLPPGTSGYFAVVTFSNGVKSWLRVIPGNIVPVEARESVIADNVKSVVDELYELDPNDSESLQKAKQIVSNMNFYLSAFGDSRITAFPEVPLGQKNFLLKFKIDLGKESASAYFSKFQKDGVTPISYNFKYILDKINRAAIDADLEVLVDPSNFRYSIAKDISEDTFEGNIRELFDIVVYPNIVSRFDARLSFGDVYNSVPSATPPANLTPAAPALPPSPTAKVTAAPVSDIKAKKAERIKRYFNRPANRMQKFNPDGENTDLTEEQIDEVEQYIEAAKEAGWNVDRTFRQLSKLGYTYAIGNSAEAFKNYLADRLSGETNIKVTSEFNINKEIDAELDALEGKPGIQDFQPGDNNPTTKNPSGLSQQEKDEQDRRDDSFNAAFKTVEKTDIEYPVTLEEQLDYIAEHLPAGITREDIQTLHFNVANNQIPVGVVINNAIYLRDVADITDLLHESFHIVFRNSLSDERSRTYLNKVKSTLNYSKEQLEIEKDRLRSTGLYDNFTESELEDQVYEEYMADNFVAWKKGQEVKSWLGKLFEKIMNFIRFYLTDDIRGVYGAIDRGYFKNSAILKTRYNSSGSANVAYKLLYGATQSQTVNAVKQVVGKILQSDNRMTVSQAINYFIEYYNPDSEENARYIKGNLEIRSEFERYQNIFTSSANQALIHEAVSKEIKKLSIDKAVIDEILNDMDPVGFDTQNQPEKQWDLSDAYVDPYTRLGRKIKGIISNTTYTAEFFGKPYQKPLDARVLYSRLLPVLSVSNTPSNMILPKLQALGKFDAQIQAFYDNLVSLMEYDPETQQMSKAGTQIYNSLVKAFELEQLVYLEVVNNVTNPESPKSRVYSLNKIDLGDARLAEWSNFWKNNVIGTTGLVNNKKAVGEITKSIGDFLVSYSQVESQNKAITKATLTPLKNSLKRLGINLEMPFLLYSFGTTEDSANLRELFTGPKITAEHLEVLLRVLRDKSDPYSEQSSINIGMYSSLKNIATGNSQFDTDFILKTFPDSEGKIRYAYVASNRILFETRKYKGLATTKAIEEEKAKNNGYLSLNPLFTTTKEAKNILSNLSIGLTGNFRTAVDEMDPVSRTSKEVYKKGVTGKDLDADTMTAMLHMLFLETKQTSATGVKYTKYWLSQISDKNTQYAIDLPVSVFWENGKLTEFAATKLYNMVKQEYFRNQGKYGEYLKRDKFLMFPFLSPTLLTLSEPQFFAQKQDILKSIEDNFINLIEAYKADLVKKELFVQGKFKFLNNESIKASYGNSDNYLGNFFLNHFIYTTGALQLFTGDIAWTKGWDDFVKRMAGAIASGNTLGTQDFILVHTTDVEENLDKTTLDTVEKASENTALVNKTDAQNWSTIFTKKYILDSLGELSPTMESAIDKIMAGEEASLTKEERKEFDGNSAKLVGFGPDSNGNEQYNKQSTFFLSKGLTSMKDEKGNWVAQPHREALHNLREYLETQSQNTQPILAAPKSSNKKYKSPQPVDLKGFQEGTPEIPQASVTRVNGQYIRKQQENDTKDKDSIVFVRQLVDLLGSEISDPSMLQVLQDFRKDLAKIRNESFNFAKNLVVKEVQGKYERADISEWIENLRHTIEMSTPDSQMLELLSLQDVDFNIPHLEKKLKQLFLNTFKGAFQKKVAGRKCTLVSPFGFKVIVDKTTGKIVPSETIKNSKNPNIWKDSEKYEIRDLRIHKLSEDGKTIEDAEFLMTRKTAEMMGINISDPSQKDYLKVFANRIPLQGKNMSAVGRIVDFLPDYYGDVIVGPKELVYLGGMDFDVDSLFVFLQNFFVNEQGKLVKYGEETSDAERFYGFKEYLYKNNSYIARDINKRLVNNPDYKVLKLDASLGENLGEFSDAALIASVMGGEIKDAAMKKITDQAISESLKKFGYPSTLEEFLESGEESEGTVQNRIHAAIHTLLKSPELAEAYKTPTNHDKTDASIKYLEGIGALPLNRKANIVPNTPSSVSNAYSNSTKGKNLTGIAVNANTASAALAEYKMKSVVPIVFGNVSYENFFTENKSLERDINDAHSTTVTNSVDNANKPVSEDLNSSKHTIPQRAILISLGVTDPSNPDKVDLEFIDSFFNLPIIKEYVKALEMAEREISPVMNKTFVVESLLMSRVEMLMNRLEAFKEKNPSNTQIQKDFESFQELIEEGNFSKKDLEDIHKYDKGLLESAGVNDLTYEQLKEVTRLNIVQANSLRVYGQLSELSKYVQALSTIMALNRKLPSELSQLSMYQKAVEMLTSEKTLLAGVDSFLSNPNVISNLTNVQDIREISELYFLDHTRLFRELEQEVSKFFSKNRETAARDFLSFITFKLLKKNTPTKYDSYYELIVPGMGKTLLEKYNELSKVDESGKALYPEFRDNPLIRALEPKPASESMKSVIDIMAMDSKTKFSSETIDMYMDSFTALASSSNPKVKEFFTDMVKYLIIKDSFQFKNYSFIKFLPAPLFSQIMQALKSLNTSLAYNSTDELDSVTKQYFGMSSRQLLDEFYKVYGSQFNNVGALENISFSSRMDDGVAEIKGLSSIKDGNYRLVEITLLKNELTFKQAANQADYFQFSKFGKFARLIDPKKNVVTLDFPPILRLNGSTDTVYFITSRTLDPNGLRIAKYQPLEVLKTRGVAPYAPSYEATQKASKMMEKILASKISERRGPDLENMDDEALMAQYYQDNPQLAPSVTEETTNPKISPIQIPIEGVLNLPNSQLTIEQSNSFIDLLQPQISKQAYVENRARTANFMFSFGLRWAKNIPNAGEQSEQGKNLGQPRPDRKAIKSKEGMTYGYYLTDQNNNSLPSIKQLQPIMDFIQSKLGIDMSNYDAMLGNIYDNTSFIHQHRDTTESVTAQNYPVIVINLGSDGHLEYDKDVTSTYASYKKSGQLNLTNGGIYAFGVDGKNRFTFHHRIGAGLESANPLKPITLPNGKVLTNYRITLTFRRASDLEPGMPATPAKLAQAAGEKQPATSEVKVLEGDIFTLPGIPVITTNLGGVHGAGLAAAAKAKGLVQQGDGLFKATDKVVQLPVKLKWSDNMSMNNNMLLLNDSLNGLTNVAKANPNKTYLLPLAGLGHGEGKVEEIMPMLIRTIQSADNIKLVIPAEGVSLGRQGTVRRDTTREKMPQIKQMLQEAGLLSKPTKETKVSEIKPGIKELFESNPELASIGTPEQYSQYLDTVFPDSKVKDIVYHGSYTKIDKFLKEFLGKNTRAESAKKGFFFSSSFKNSLEYVKDILKQNRKLAFDGVVYLNLNKVSREIQNEFYSKVSGEFDDDFNGILIGDELNNLPSEVKTLPIFSFGILEAEGNITPYSSEFLSYEDTQWRLNQLSDFQIAFRDSNKSFENFIKDYVHFVVLNVKNPLVTSDNNSEFREDSYSNRLDKAVSENKDSLIIKDTKDPLSTDVLVVLEPEQIHILGNKQDIKEFKDFVAAKPQQVSETQKNTITLKDGKTYTYDQINARMLMNTRLYTPEEIGEILKKLCS